MAFNAATQWEVRTGGSDTICSGGFNPANANFLTDGAATSATGNSAVFTSASYTFVAGDVGAKVFVKSGTNWNPGWYEIASVAGGAATLLSAIGEGVVYAGANLTTNFALQVATTVAGVATTGSPTGATWGVDYSQQNAAQIAFTDMVIGGTTTQFTSVANPVGKNFVGNTIRVTSGTGFTVQTVEVVSTSGTTATCDKSLGTGGSTGGNGYLGGAYLGPQLLMALPIVAGNTVWMKAGSYTWSAVNSNVTLGRTTLIANTQLVGYNSTRGDNSTTRPVVTPSGSASNYCFTGGTYGLMRNLEVSLASFAGTSGFNHNSSDVSYGCKVSNVNASQFGFLNGTQLFCIVDTGGTGYGSGGYKFQCVAKGLTTGFSATTIGFSANRCISVTCTTGFNLTVASTVSNCVAYNSTNGFVVTAQSFININLCIAHTSSSRGFDANTGSFLLTKCAAYLSTTADVRYNSSGVAPSINDGFITLSADPFTAVGSNNFSLNNTAGGGALLRGLALAFPATISTTTYTDAGIAQHQDSGGAGGSFTFS